MGIAIQMFVKLYGVVAELALPIVLAALVWLWVSDGAKLHELREETNQLHDQIDNPKTGYVVVLGEARAAAAQLRANLATAAQVVADTNYRLEQASALGEQRRVQTEAALRRLEARQQSAKQLTELISSFKPTGDVCRDADSVLKEAGQ